MSLVSPALQADSLPADPSGKSHMLMDPKLITIVSHLKHF